MQTYRQITTTANLTAMTAARTTVCDPSYSHYYVWRLRRAWWRATHRLTARLRRLSHLTRARLPHALALAALPAVLAYPLSVSASVPLPPAVSSGTLHRVTSGSPSHAQAPADASSPDAFFLHLSRAAHRPVLVTSIHRAVAKIRPVVAKATRAVFTTYRVVSAPSGGISQWTYTGHPAYSEPTGGTQGYPWGWCTAGAAQLARDWVGGLGNAGGWAWAARARGMAVGYTPQAGATVVFAPGVQGAGGSGHVAHVVTVYAGGWFLIAEVNFTFNGGGFGRVDYRYAHAGAGVQFIY